MSLTTEKGTHFVLGYRKSSSFQNAMHIFFTQLKCHPELLKDHIIRNRCLDRTGRMVFTLSPFVIDKAIQKMSHENVTAIFSLLIIGQVLTLKNVGYFTSFGFVSP